MAINSYSRNTLHCVQMLKQLERFAFMDFQRCREVPRGHGKPVELVRGLETSRPQTFISLGSACKKSGCMHSLATPGSGLEVSRPLTNSMGLSWPLGTSLHH